MQCGRPRFDSWVGKIPWRRKWQPTPILWPGKFHGRRSPVGYSPWGHKELDTTERLHFTADKKLGLSRWGGFAPGWISPGGSSEARGPLREAYGRSAPGPRRERSAPPQTPRQWVPGLRGLHCGRERPFRGLLGPHRLASSERSGGVRATGGLGGAGWSGDPRIPPSLLAQSRSPLTWWSQKGLAIGVKAFTTLPLRIKLRPARFSQAARSPGSPGDLSCLVISLAGTPQSVLWPAGPALLLAVCSPAGP